MSPPEPFDLLEAQLVAARPESLAEAYTHYCPGCGHGIVHRLVAEAIDRLDLRERTVCVAPVGCAVFAYRYFNMDCCVAPHGRAPAVATGLKRVRPDLIVFTYQGDGDLAAIGTNEIVHAAARGERLTVIFVNNAIYGMTGGQMAPTTLPGMRTTSSPNGRDVTTQGWPIRIPEMLASFPGVAYAVRRSLHDARAIRQAGQAVERAFRCQALGLGLALVEILSPCPTNWHMTPVQAMEWIEREMIGYYPPGDFKVAPELTGRGA
ncbi:MAG: thiamine pyrophosphate-dependent enzyme [Anaerolineae bacterium]